MSAAAPPDAPAIPNATGPDPAVMEAMERGNAVVFLDVALGDAEGAPLLGRIKLELFVKDVRYQPFSTAEVAVMYQSFSVERMNLPLMLGIIVI